jgi:hypothetical protein
MQLGAALPVDLQWICRAQLDLSRTRVAVLGCSRRPDAATRTGETHLLSSNALLWQCVSLL